MSIPPINSSSDFQLPQTVQQEARQIAKGIQKDLNKLLIDTKNRTITPGEATDLFYSLQQKMGELTKLESTYPGMFTPQQKETTNSLNEQIITMAQQISTITPGQLEDALSTAQSLYF